MRIFVSAGEVSGDQVLAAILAALRPLAPGLSVAGLGGAAAAEQGLSPRVPLVGTAVSGVGDVLASLPRLWRARRAALECLEGRESPTGRRGPRPDLALLVDYPGLNLELAARARALGIPVYYVAPPQAWLYRNPGKKAAKAVTCLRGAVVHVLFPFERETFAATAARVVRGHFLAEAVEAGSARIASGRTGAPGERERERALGLCPGSRRMALRRNLPAWLSALGGAGVLPSGPGREVERVLVLVPPHLVGEAEALCRSARDGAGPGGPGIEVIADKGRFLRETRWALAFPGTITLELGLAGVAAAVLGCVDPLTLALGRRALKGPWLGLPNLLLGREAFPEWVGARAELSAGVAAALWKRLRDPVRSDGPGEGARLREIMGPAFGAAIAATECLKILERARDRSESPAGRA